MPANFSSLSPSEGYFCSVGSVNVYVLIQSHEDCLKLGGQKVKSCKQMIGPSTTASIPIIMIAVWSMKIHKSPFLVTASDEKTFPALLIPAAYSYNFKTPYFKPPYSLFVMVYISIGI